jgi:hypothetical protein
MDDDRSHRVDTQVFTFRAQKTLVAAVERAGAAEGTTKSDVVIAQRIRDLVRHGWLARPAGFRREQYG